jgi:hypothetical protein
MVPWGYIETIEENKMEHLTTAEALGVGLLFFAVFVMGIGVGKVRSEIRQEED